jgi:hypothetical protein
MGLVLRHFLYLDDEMVAQFLEQLEGGGYDEEAVTSRGEQRRGLSAGVRAGPAEARAERGRAGSEETAVTMRQTPASRFDRLYRILTDHQAVQELVVFDDDIWEQLVTGEVVEVAATLSISDIAKHLAAVGSVEGLMPLIEMVNELMDDDEAIDPHELDTVKRQLPAVSGLAQQAEASPVPCLVEVAALRRYKFLARLRRASLRCALDELDGEATVMGKIQRKLAKGQSEPYGDELVGLPNLSRQARRKAGQRQLRLGYPGAVLTPIAIWR